MILRRARCDQRKVRGVVVRVLERDGRAAGLPLVAAIGIGRERRERGAFLVDRSRAQADRVDHHAARTRGEDGKAAVVGDARRVQSRCRERGASTRWRRCW